MTINIKLATYNIQFGRGRDMLFDIERIAEEVRGADIIAFQEVTQGWARTNYEDQPARLAAKLGHNHVFGAGFDVDAGLIDESEPNVRRRRTFGNMVSSRWPIRSTRTMLLPKNSALGVFDLQRSVTEAIVETPAGPLRVYSCHLSHISSGQRMPQVKSLLDFIHDAPINGAPWDHTLTEDWTEGWSTPKLPEPAILMGDMNATYASPEYDFICGEFSPHFGRIARCTNLVDCWTSTGHTREEGVSINNPDFGSIRIDHAFVTPSLSPFVTAMHIDSEAQGSDHFPVFVEITLPAPLSG